VAGLLRPDPPDDQVVVGVAVGVLQGELGLADAAKADDRRGLGERGALSRGEGSVEAVQQVFSAGEVGVVGVGDVRDLARGLGRFWAQ